ncbi:NifB/NifX family molybdenum-iron cluster-binding protein [Christensenellaceae bacterium OttesenSCG-928-K19]|nr:NifB/NifX family molybdenum-iron cluster-binding protein [Christensenellaceae bacterium OttesenSCG-928-K19]
MKIAVTYEEENIFQHFGHTEQFKLYEIENGKVQSTDILQAGENGHGALAGYLKDHGVEVLICGGIGGGAKNALKEAGIKLFGGVVGNADKAVADFLENKLAHNPDVSCNHHGEGHSCSDHA